MSLLLKRYWLAVCLGVFGAVVSAGAASAQLATAELEKVVGQYNYLADPDTPLSFYVKDDTLFVEGPRQYPIALVPVSATEFRPADGREDHREFYFSGTGGGLSLKVTDEDRADVLMTRVGDTVRRSFHTYERREEMVPVRDGVKLHVVILTPTDMAGPVPILIQRTPYGVDGTSAASFYAGRPQLAEAGYIYVGADIRGRFKSEGEFVMMRPLADHSNPRAVDESTDAYDTIDWLLKNVPKNSGTVGLIGTSYPGFLTTMSGIDPHPAVKAISPQAPMIDVWLGDDFFHNGAFRQTYGYDYAYSLETGKENADVSYGTDSQGNPRDGYDFFLERGSFIADVKKSGVDKKLPTWEGFLEHPTYDSYWRAHAVEYHLTKVAVPTLTVGGYYDQEDMFGPQEEYASLEPHDADHQNFLVLGPWRHGSWASSSRHLGALQYGQSIGDEYRAQIEAKFFGHYLKDEPGFDLVDTASFQTGSNTWKRYGHFPPATAKSTAYCLGAGGVISGGSGCAEGKTTYVADPANPVPYRHRPIQPTYGKHSEWYTWMVEDQHFVTSRPDVAVWKLPVLDHDLTVTGEVMADIFAATTGSDGDFVAKLIDQYPDDDADPAMRGFQLMTNMEIFRGRYRTSFEKPEALKPGAVHEFKWSLHDVDHVFKKGHTLMVEIQSSWFPLYDRNPQTFVTNIMTAKPEDYKAATVTIVSDAGHRSAVVLPVVP